METKQIQTDMVVIELESQLWEESQKEGKFVFCSETHETWKCVWTDTGEGLTWQRADMVRLKDIDPDFVEVKGMPGSKNLQDWEIQNLVRN